MRFRVSEIRVFLVLLLSSFSMVPAAIAQPSDLKQILSDLYKRPDRILVSAHRADHAIFPENSLPAIGKAIEAGIDIVELDVRETRDKVLVLMHDEKVDRTTTGKGAVSDLSYKELQEFYLLQDGKPTGNRIPTFEEALKKTKGHILIDIDFKAETQTAKDETYRLLRKYGMERQVFLFIYDYKEATEYRALDPRVPIMPRAYKDEDVHAILQMGRFPAVHVDETFYSDTLMGSIRATGMRVWINALGKYDELEEKAVRDGSPGDGFASLLKDASQANFIQTDYPEQLLAWLRKKGLHR
ncbi:MAG: glycerophosphodiester phosphodiesterase family protein [Puia sp.]|nr:glycerophosphodiester phosphodiesterase family protein [Puia sp.]